MRKFAISCRELQGLIDAEEHGISVSEMPTETFAQYTLGRSVGSLKSCQQVLGVLWSLDNVEIVIDLQYIFTEAVSNKTASDWHCQQHL